MAARCMWNNEGNFRFRECKNSAVVRWKFEAECGQVGGMVVVALTRRDVFEVIQSR